MPHPGQAGSGADSFAGNLVVFLAPVFIGFSLVWLFVAQFFFLVVDAPGQESRARDLPRRRNFLKNPLSRTSVRSKPLDNALN
jgi:hypothetical protein